jgi:hypothetical protein
MLYDKVKRRGTIQSRIKSSFLDSYFIGGFKYDGKAVFGVIETSDRTETVRSDQYN